MRRTSHRRWTDEETDYMIHLIQCGWSTRRIASVLKRSLDGIWKHCEIYGGIDAIRNKTFSVRSKRQIMELFNVSLRSVDIWIANKWLRGHRNRAEAGHSTRQRYLIPDEALEEFIPIQEAWMLWTPNEITDSDWRHYALSVRPSGTGGEWCTIPECASHLGVGQETVRNWCRTGTVVRSQQIGCHWYVWWYDGALIPLRIHHQKRLWRQRIKTTWRQTYDTFRPADTEICHYAEND